MTKTKNLWSALLLTGAVGVSIFLLLFVITGVWIGNEVKTVCQAARREYKGDCTTALIKQLNDQHRGYRARNDAIWALGQLGDKRAYPVLKKYYTGQIPNREPLDQTISQYELKKAVNLTGGGINITAIFWRHGVN